MPGPTTSTIQESKAYRKENAKSRQLHERAVRVMPGGNTRHSIALAPYPIYAESGHGCWIRDVEGEERIDFLNNYTSLIRGHADPEVVAAVQEQAALGTAYTMPTENTVALAELIVDRVPYLDQIRFCNSGTEAVLLTIKAARAWTGKRKIAKFEGAYHGLYDYVQASEHPTAEEWGDAEAPATVLECGSAPGIALDTVILPWNNLAACRELIRRHGEELAGVVVDPLPSALGMIAPRPGLLETLREETRRVGALLIGDEVMSFRLAYDGAMTVHGIEPDLTAMGKIIGGGFPVGAVAGKREVMAVFDHTGNWKVHHAGTFNGNPVTMAAGYANMRQMTEAAYERLARMGEYIRERLRRMLKDRGIPAQICGRASLFMGHLTGEELVDYRSLGRSVRANPAYGGLCHEMLGNGIVIGPRGIFGALSTPMTETELDAFVDALDRSLTSIRAKS